MCKEIVEGPRKAWEVQYQGKFIIMSIHKYLQLKQEAQTPYSLFDNKSLIEITIRNKLNWIAMVRGVAGP